MATYTDLIRAMRSRGFRAPIVIDAADCGQATQSFLNGRGKTLQALDPLHNVIVSVHAYNLPWNSPQKIDQNISDLHKEGVPFLLGEFGDRELFEAGNAVDHLHLMQAAQQTRTGWISWSWKGNGGITKVLDMSENYGKVRLTRRGHDVVDGPYGLRATAR
jgi:mannan endo-1,4-beta-mannosidase